MSNIVENNNSFTDFKQIWTNYIFTDQVPVVPPELSTAASSATVNNKDGTVCTIHRFQKTEHENTYDYLIYVSNFELSKEFRQGKTWKLEFANDEESIRNVILPSVNANRLYLPMFSNGDVEIPFTSLDPVFDLRDCRINVKLDFDKLYFTGWLYVGKNLQNILDNNLPPFDDDIWLIKNKITGNKVSFHINQEQRYELPADTFEDTEDSHTLISTNILNQVINKFGRLDEDECW